MQRHWLPLVALSALAAAQDALQCDATCRFFTSLLTDHLQWTRVFLLTDTNGVIDQLLPNLYERDVAIAMLTITSTTEKRQRQMTPRNAAVWLKKRVAAMHEAHVVVYCYSSTTDAILGEILRSYTLRSLSVKWVIFLGDLGQLSDYSSRALFQNAVFAVNTTTESSFALCTESLSSGQPECVATWSPEGLHGTTVSALHRRPIQRLRAAMEKHVPFYIPEEETSSGRPEGVDINILDSVASVLNITYEIQKPSDKKWGSWNNTWNGMVGMLVRQEVDVAMSGMSVSLDRLLAVDFTVPYAFDRTTFVTKATAEVSRTWAIFRPYTWQAWAAILGAILLESWALCVIDRSAADLCGDELTCGRPLCPSKSVLYVLGACLTQGGYDAKRVCTRVLLTSWWMFACIVTTGYGSSLMSLLTHPGHEEPVDTIRELTAALDSGQYMVGTILDSSDHTMLKDQDVPLFTRILAAINKEGSNFVTSDVEGLQRCLNYPYAYIGGELTIQADIQDESQFLFAKDSFQLTSYSMAVLKGFYYTDTFNQVILWLQESGLVDKWIKDGITRYKKPGLVHVAENMEHALTMGDLQGSFLLLVAGLFMGTLLLWFERQAIHWQVK